MIENTIIPWLAAHASITALVGTRFYRAVAPATATRPYIVWLVVSSESEHNHDGLSMRTHRVQFSIFADAAATVDPICGALLTLLDGKRLSIAPNVVSFMASTIAQYEPDTKLHHTAIDIEFRVT